MLLANCLIRKIVTYLLQFMDFHRIYYIPYDSIDKKELTSKQCSKASLQQSSLVEQFGNVRNFGGFSRLLVV